MEPGGRRGRGSPGTKPAVTATAPDTTRAPGAKIAPSSGWAARGGAEPPRGGGSERPGLRPRVRRRARGQSLGRGLLESWRAYAAGRRGEVRRAVGNKVLNNNVNSGVGPAGEPHAPPQQGSQVTAFPRARLLVSF